MKIIKSLAVLCLFAFSQIAFASVDGERCVSDAISYVGSGDTISIFACQLDENDVAMLSNYIRTNKNITRLYLNETNISE